MSSIFPSIIIRSETYQNVSAKEGRNRIAQLGCISPWLANSPFKFPSLFRRPMIHPSTCIHPSLPPCLFRSNTADSIKFSKVSKEECECVWKLTRSTWHDRACPSIDWLISWPPPIIHHATANVQLVRLMLPIINVLILLLLHESRV